MEVREPEEIAEVCSALSHPSRVHLYNILCEERETKLTVLTNLASSALPEPMNYMTVKHHVHRMAEADLVELGEKDGQIAVAIRRPHIRIYEGEQTTVDASEPGNAKPAHG